MRSAFAGRVSCVLSVFLLFAQADKVAAGLTWVDPLPQGNGLADVAFLDESTAIAVGAAGAVMITHDAGLTWSASWVSYLADYPDYLRASFTRIARIDDATAIAPCTGGLRRTTDAGETWTLLPSPPPDPNDLDFEDGLGISVSGSALARGVFRSLDGGQSWSKVDTHSAYAVDVVTGTLVVAVGSGTFLASSDAGQTWNSLSFPSPDNATAVSFIDAMHGVVAVGGRFLYVTGDGGATWEERALDPIYPDAWTSGHDVKMLDAQTILVAAGLTGCDPVSSVCSSGGQFLRTSDGGLTWDSEFGPRPFVGLARNASGVVLLVGSGGVISRWTQADGIRQVAGSTREVTDGGGHSAFSDAAHGVVLGNHHSLFLPGATTTVLRTGDGGRTWSSTWMHDTHLTDVAAPSSHAFYAVGSRMAGTTDENVLLESTDRGRSWKALWSEETTYGTTELQAIAFASPSHGMAVGRRGHLLVIDHDSVTSGRASLSLQEDLWDVAMADPSTAVAVGGDHTGRGFVYRTTDGGATWTPIRISVISPPSFYAVAFASPEVCLAGGEGRLYRSEDGGQTWDTVTFTGFPESPSDIRAIAFVSSTHGLAVGSALNSGVLFETWDAGRTWARAGMPTTSSLNGVAYVNAHQAVVTGEGLEILACQSATAPGRIRKPDGSGGPQAVATVSSAALELLPNQPNPFNPSTTLRFVLPVSEHVRLSIFDVSGRRVVTLVDEARSAGLNTVHWNGTNERGQPVASGLYVSRLEAGKETLTRKLVLLK